MFRKEDQLCGAPAVERTGHIPQYDILRVILTLLVVIGHSSYCSHVTPAGG